MIPGKDGDPAPLRQWGGRPCPPYTGTGAAPPVTHKG